MKHLFSRRYWRRTFCSHYRIRATEPFARHGAGAWWAGRCLRCGTMLKLDITEAVG